MGENEIKEVTEQARKQVPIQGKIEPLVKKEWPATREGTKRHGAQMVIIANEGKPMDEVIKLIMATIGCSYAEARSHYVFQVKNGMAPGAITTQGAPIEAKTEAPVKKEWPATREGSKRHRAQMVIIANEGKPMEEIIKLIMGTIGCSHSEARSHFVYQVKNAIAPGVITTTPGGAGDPANVVIIRKLSPETHRALKARAWSHGRSTEAEIRAILDAAVRPADEIGIGSALAALGRRFRVDELEITRESAPAQPMRFE